MKLLFINIMQSCNQSCSYCPAKLYPLGFRFNPDPSVEPDPYWLKEYPDMPTAGMPVNAITNKVLLRWLDEYIAPGEWVIELTGGEPGLYPEIDTLIPELDNRGYRGTIKTNGSLPIPKSKGFIRTAAWHKDVKDIPPYYDKILIIKNPYDDWMEKVDYCKERDIPYRLLTFSNKKNPRKIIIDTVTSFDGMSVILSMGQICSCYIFSSNEHNIFKMSPPVIKDLKTDENCKKCVHALSTEADLRIEY